MELFIDADGCPVVNLAISIAQRHRISCTLLCDTAHKMDRPGATTITVSKGADSVDFTLVNLLHPGDVVVTQDYGLAAMCLSRGALVLHQSGMPYTDENMDSLLFVRAVSQKIRRSGGRVKGPGKRTKDQDAAFAAALDRLLSENCP